MKVRITIGSDSPPDQIVIAHQHLIRRLKPARLNMSIGNRFRQREQQQRSVGFVVAYPQGGKEGVGGGHWVVTDKM